MLVGSCGEPTLPSRTLALVPCTIDTEWRFDLAASGERNEKMNCSDLKLLDPKRRLSDHVCAA